MSPAPEGDGYLYPGTRTLRNKRDIRDPDRLRDFELDSCRARLAELLSTHPLRTGAFDTAHMKAMHAHLFGDVYDWAGQERRSGRGLTKFGASPDSIRSGDYGAQDVFGYDYMVAGEATWRYADGALSRLPTVEEAAALSPSEFAHAIATPWGELNTAHLFREGNTRTQVAFFTCFARAAGHPFDYDRFSHDAAFRDRFNAARFIFQRDGNVSLLREVLSAAVSGGTP